MSYPIEIDAPKVPFPGGTSHADFMREAADRIAGGYSMGSNLTATVVDLLRRVADEMDRVKPPHIPEPKGLGAVVETDGGVRFVRTPDGQWESEDERQTWANVYALRVLSEGVL